MSEKEGPEGGILTEGKVEVFVVDINKFKRVDIWLQKVSLPTAREGTVFRSVCQSFCPRGQGGVGFPACISGHMTRGLHPGVCIWGSVSRGVCIQEGLHPERSASGVCITGGGYASGGSASRWGLGRPPLSALGDRQTPLMTSSGGHCSGLYASYWKAFLQFYEFYKETSLFGGDFNISTLAHYFTLSEAMAVLMADR